MLQDKFEFTKEAKRLYLIGQKLKKNPLQSKPDDKKLRLVYDSKKKEIISKLESIYGKDDALFIFDRIESKIKEFRSKRPKKIRKKDSSLDPIDRFTQKDVVLITYPDSIQQKGMLPLEALESFLLRNLLGTINTIHILPFHPYSSDKGFSVINYRQVKESFGTWEDIESIGKDFNLMIDGVFNHMSRHSIWFKGFLDDDPEYANHFISFDSKDAISENDKKKIIRPRTSDILTPFTKDKKKIYLWTTFSSDHIDLNYKEPIVLLRIIDIMLRYISHGTSIIRLDAINYLWKEIGTSCSNLKQTHLIVQVFRDILDIAAPSVSIITETNIPYAQNIKYFGNGRDEAQMVYNFALAPLLIYTFYKGNVKHISRWASRLQKVSDYCTFYNFISSHDGIELNPVKRILPKEEISFMIKEARKRGAHCIYKTDPDGNKEPYEIDITGWDVLNANLREQEKIKVKRYIASKAIQFSLKGVPGIYINSLFAAKNNIKAYEKSKNPRDLNRKSFTLESIEKDILKKGVSLDVFEKISELVKARSKQKAFHPAADEKIIIGNDAVFSLIRTSLDNKEKVLVAINVTSTEQDFDIDCIEHGLDVPSMYDIVRKKKMINTNKRIKVERFDLRMKPYEVRWIRCNI